MKKKETILFYYSVFNLGGAERSTSKLITKLLDIGYNVEVLLITNGGDFQNKIDSRAKVNWLRSRNYGDLYSKREGLYKIIYFFLYILTRFESNLKGFFYKFKSYKSVIVGLHGLSPKFCLDNIKADTYIQYIRNDLKKCDKNHKAQNQIKKYGSRITNYICVSQTALDSFKQLFPNLKNKGKKIYNLLEADVIQQKSKEIIIDINWNNSSINVLTVCRIQDKSKGIYRMAKVLTELLSKGYKIKWYVIGDGIDFRKFNKYLIENNLSENMILLGSKLNPYPYFKKADLIAVLSYYEGLCGVVNEAKILERPLIATEFSGIREQITEGVNGFIVDNNYESIIKGMEYVLKNSTLRLNSAINKMPAEIIDDDFKVKQLVDLF